ncbi:MAG: colanic acid biosynthesis glycosyltransferase WcaL [Verrucomicrobiaceae bacterium]|nr:colanic acid biosynthesis glycosyltransferase WcaL [Verrucomicrobiaceae bacterium]
MQENDRKQPVVTAYLPTFLPSDMRHVYRQIVGVKRYRNAVIVRKRKNEASFPLPEERIRMVRRPLSRALRRWWFAQVKKGMIPLSAGETREILDAIAWHGTDVFHVYFGSVAAQLLPVLRKLSCPIVVSFHGADAGVDTENHAYREALKEVFEVAELVLARSESLVKRLRELGCHQDKLRLNPTGIPTEAFPFKQRVIPPEDGCWRFLQVCRLVEKKGLPVSLRAFVEVRKTHPSAEFHIAGDGPLRVELEALARELDADQSVHFHGFVDQAQLARLAGDAHIFLHPSQMGADGNREGVPNAMLEAMSTGLPVVATRHGGIPEAVTGGESGFLVNEGDCRAVAAASLDLMADPDLYRKCAQGASDVIEQRFATSGAVGILEACYDEALEIGRSH